jgi:3-deoxy-manno-octulosonate cytidylyltransferase (CMP-KDO synthetase)
MSLLGDRTVIRRTYEAAAATGLFEKVILVTDSPMIFTEIAAMGGEAIMSKNSFESGTDRIAEAVEDLDAEIILNVQGDTPFIQKESLQKVLAQFDDPAVQVASIMQPIYEKTDIENPNVVKVTIDRQGFSLFFSRSVIPYPREEKAVATYYKHIGVYAFRRQALLDFTRWPMTPLEITEKIECLRFLENGIRLKMVEVEQLSIEIDTPEDLERARAFLESSS